MTWNERYTRMKKHFGWKNKDIAEKTGLNANSIKDTTQPNKSFPRWARLAVVVYEAMKKEKDEQK